MDTYNDNRAIAKLALKHHLFISDWWMQSVFRAYVFEPRNDVLYDNLIFAIYTDKKLSENPIASAIYYDNERIISIFVHHQYRFQGVGSKILDELLIKANTEKDYVFAGYGIPGSEEFYKKIGVYTIDFSLYPNFSLTPREKMDLKNKKKTIYQVLENRHRKNFPIYDIDVKNFEKSSLDPD